MTNPYQTLKEKDDQAEQGGGPEAIAKQKALGKMTARERISALLDSGSFNEIGKFVTHRSTLFGMEQKKFLGDGVMTGYGKIEGRPVLIYAQDSTVLGGALGEAGAGKIRNLIDLSVKIGVPIIGLTDSGGVRVQEGAAGMGAFVEVASHALDLSGVVPQISVILGSSAGGSVYYSGGCDFVIMVKKQSHMFVTSPEVIRDATGEEISREDLGGAEVHATRSGAAHFIVDKEQEAFSLVVRLLSYIPPNHRENPPDFPATDPVDREIPDLEKLIPDDTKRPYDMRTLIEKVVDTGSFFEIHALFAKNILVGLARFGGRVAGIVANQPAHQAGCIDILATWKGARFIRFCDSFNIPLVTFVDVPGFLPGSDQEHGGIINHGTKLFFAYGEATVPKITLIVRKAYGGGYGLMCSKQMRSDVNLAYPMAEIGVVGPEGAVSILFRRELGTASDPKKRHAELLSEFAPMYKGALANPYQAAELGYLDEIIEPSQTRKRIIQSLEMLKGKFQQTINRKHNTMPL